MKNNLKKPTVVSLFSGCGGIDLGFEQAGFETIWANDIDKSACETFAYNLGKKIVCGNIQEMNLEAVPRSDVIIGGFPCQDFSLIGTRKGLETKRGNLYRDFVSLVKAKQPLAFVAENVKGLLSSGKGKVIEQIVKDFEDCGYNVTYKLINFADYGVAQLRQRVLIVGLNQTIGKTFVFPLHLRQKSDYVTASQALEGVESVEWNNQKHNDSPKLVERMKMIPPCENFRVIPKGHPLYVRATMSLCYRRLHPDKPSTTIIANGGGGTWGYHYAEPRRLTNRERARLFGYPDDFVFLGSLTQVRRQIGNSVPPLGIKPIAEKLREYLEDVSA